MHQRPASARAGARAGAGVAAALGLVAASLIASPVASPALAAPDEAAPPFTEIRWPGESGGDLGYGSSRWSCDVNGDGLSDTVVGDWWWDRPGAGNAGAAYVLLGSENPVGGQIGQGTAVGAVRIDGPAQSNAYAGMSVSCLNDINGDGFDDVILGSNRTQRSWVILGAEDFTPVDVESLGARGFEITNSDAVTGNVSPRTANFGYWVTGLGDVNGDGLADFAVVDNLYDRPADPEAGTPAADNIGRVWVIAGSQNVNTIDVAGEAGAQRVLLTIDGAGGQIISAENIGDINGDGLDDVVLGSYAATPWGAEVPVSGAAYAVFGSETAQHVVVDDLGDQGFAVYGGQRARDRLGTAVAPVGDINGDGLADFVVGGDGVSNATTGPRNGGAAVVFGSASTQTVFTDPGASSNAVYSCSDEALNTSGTCADDTVPRGYWIDGAADGDKLGWSAAGIGDLNGDGVPETALGAWGHDAAGSNAGALFVVYGQPEGNGTISTADLDAELGFRLDGASAGAQLGRSVGGVADFDGNGVPDILGGANGTDYASVFLMGLAKTTLSLQAGELSMAAGGTLTATVTTPRSGLAELTGTVAFSLDGEAIAGCEAVAVNAEGVAVCEPESFASSGEHEFTAAFSDTSGAFASSSAEIAATITRLEVQVHRHSGKDRYTTNAAVNEAVAQTGKPVFVATGASFPDALSIGPVVAKEEGTLFLTQAASLSSAQLQQISDAEPSEVYIVGGTGAVSAKVAAQLEAETGIAPERIQGADRYATSAKILETFFDGDVAQAFVATGLDYPDALSAAAAGGALDAPVLLSDGASLAPAIGALLEEKHTESLVLVGGSGALKPALEQGLAASFDVTRLSGANRYATNAAVNGFVAAEAGDVALSDIWVATGANFPDALSAAAPAGSPSKRLVLSNGSCLPKPVVSEWINGSSSRVQSVNLVGGTGVLKASVANLTECK